METSIFDWSICCFQYNDTNRKPLSLPCGHVYCQDCIFKLIKGDQSKPSIPSEIRKNLVLDEMQTQIICPSDNIVHKVIPSSLPIWYIIIQHLPKSKEGRDITTWYTNRLPTAASDFSNEESEKYRKDFRHLLKQFTEEYRSSKHWEETIRQVEKRHTGKEINYWSHLLFC